MKTIIAGSRGMDNYEFVKKTIIESGFEVTEVCLLYTSPSPRDGLLSRMPSSA